MIFVETFRELPVAYVIAGSQCSQLLFVCVSSLRDTTEKPEHTRPLSFVSPWLFICKEGPFSTVKSTCFGRRGEGYKNMFRFLFLWVWGRILYH